VGEENGCRATDTGACPRDNGDLPEQQSPWLEIIALSLGSSRFDGTDVI
jgi:hypothetical protein